MSGMERTILVSAIYDSHIDDELCFVVNSRHDPSMNSVDVRGYWEVILSPNAGRLYFIERVIALIQTLDIEVSIFTNINNPGCIIIR